MAELPFNLKSKSKPNSPHTKMVKYGDRRYIPYSDRDDQESKMGQSIDSRKKYKKFQCNLNRQIIKLGTNNPWEVYHTYFQKDCKYLHYLTLCLN